MDSNIKTIVFDLGGVIIDLGVQASLNKLAQLLNKSIGDIIRVYHSNDFFRSYEKGMIDDNGFRKGIRALTINNISDDQIDSAWNAMLLDIPPSRMELIRKIRSEFQLLVLSNTNAIHVEHFNNILEKSTGKSNLEYFFDKVHFSHEMRMRKPDEEIYRFLLEDNHLKPEETLFLDDNKDNLFAAEKLGIKTIHIEYPDRLFEIFKAWT